MAHRWVTDDGGSAVNPVALATFAVDQVQACAVVVARGEIDLSTAPALRDALLEAARRSARVIVDLTEVTFLDSFGMGVIAATTLTSNHDQQNASPCLVGPSGMVRKALEISGVTRLFPIFATVEEAVQHLASSSRAPATLPTTGDAETAPQVPRDSPEGRGGSVRRRRVWKAAYCVPVLCPQFGDRFRRSIGAGRWVRKSLDS